MGTFLHRGHVKNHGGSFTGKSDRYLKGALKAGHLYGLSMKGAWRGLLYWGPEGYVEEGSDDWYLSIGAPLGNLEGDSFAGDFEKWIRWVSLSVGAPLGDLGRGSFYRELRDFAEGWLWLWSISPCGSSLLGEPGRGLLC